MEPSQPFRREILQEFTTDAKPSRTRFPALSGEEICAPGGAFHIDLSRPQNPPSRANESSVGHADTGLGTQLPGGRFLDPAQCSQQGSRHGAVVGSGGAIMPFPLLGAVFPGATGWQRTVGSGVTLVVPLLLSIPGSSVKCPIRSMAGGERGHLGFGRGEQELHLWGGMHFGGITGNAEFRAGQWLGRALCANMIAGCPGRGYG